MKVMTLFVAAALPLGAIAQTVSLDVGCLPKADQDAFVAKVKEVRAVHSQKRYVPGPVSDPAEMVRLATATRDAAQGDYDKCLEGAKVRQRNPAVFCEKETVLLRSAGDSLAKMEQRAVEMRRIDQEELADLAKARAQYPACEASKVVQDAAAGTTPAK